MGTEPSEPKKRSVLSFVIFLILVWMGARLIGDWMFGQGGADEAQSSGQTVEPESSSSTRTP